MTTVGFPCLDTAGGAVFVPVMLGLQQDWQQLENAVADKLGLETARLNLVSAFPAWSLRESWSLRILPANAPLKLAGFSATLAGMISGISSHIQLRRPWKNVPEIWATGPLSRTLAIQPVNADGFTKKLLAFANSPTKGIVFFVPADNDAEHIVPQLPYNGDIDVVPLASLAGHLHKWDRARKLVVSVAQNEASMVFRTLFDVNVGIQPKGTNYWRLVSLVLLLAVIAGAAGFLSIRGDRIDRGPRYLHTGSTPSLREANSFALHGDTASTADAGAHDSAGSATLQDGSHRQCENEGPNQVCMVGLTSRLFDGAWPPDSIEPVQWSKRTARDNVEAFLDSAALDERTESLETSGDNTIRLTIDSPAASPADGGVFDFWYRRFGTFYFCIQSAADRNDDSYTFCGGVNTTVTPPTLLDRSIFAGLSFVPEFAYLPRSLVSRTVGAYMGIEASIELDSSGHNLRNPITVRWATRGLRGPFVLDFQSPVGEQQAVPVVVDYGEINVRVPNSFRIGYPSISLCISNQDRRFRLCRNFRRDPTTLGPRDQ